MDDETILKNMSRQDVKSPGSQNTHLGSGSSGALSQLPANLSQNRQAKRKKLSTQESAEVKQKMSSLWQNLQTEIRSLLHSGTVERPYAAVSRDAELLCVYKHSEQARMSDFIYQEIEGALDSIVVPQIQHHPSDIPAELVRHFIACFDEWNNRLRVLLQLFVYLDRGYLLPHPRKSCISKYGSRLFASRLLDAAPGTNLQQPDVITSSLIKVCAEVRQNANSENYQTALRGVKLYETLEVAYGLRFNASLKDQIRREYSALQREWMETPDRYILTALEAVNNESKFLQAAGKPIAFVKDVAENLIWVLILSDFNEAIKHSLPSLLESDDYAYLKALKDLCESSHDTYWVDSTKVLIVQWGEYVTKKTKHLIEDRKKIGLIPSLVELRTNFSHIAQNVFVDDLFTFEVRTAIARALSDRKHTLYVLTQLSKYCDAFMKGKTSKSFEEFENEVISVFKLIPNKSDFAAIYARDLSKRMIIGKSFQRVNEQALVDSILSLMGEADDGFNLKAMFRDMERSQADYTSIDILSIPGLDFNALILEKKCWPEIPSQGNDLVVPEPFNAALTEFDSLYKKADARLQSHKLDWSNYALHQIVMKAQFETQKKELIVNMLQAAVLMQFQDADELDISTIAERTKLDERLLKRVLSSLSSDKYSILTIKGSVAIFNLSFKDKSVRIRLPMGKDKEVVTEELQEVIERNRSPEIRCTITRIMKQEKKMMYAELLGQGIQKLESKGPILLQEIKLEVEYLISSEYIRRDIDGTALHYVP